MKQRASTEIVSPFDWRRFTAAEAAPGPDRPRKPASRAKKKMTVKERVERIMAQRWGNPYCKPGAAY